MTNSRSRASRTRVWAVLVVLCAVFGAGGVAEAGRKRVVVLDFEGPKGGAFHDELVKLIKKTHTVVPTDKWNGAAEELDASAVSEKNIKKVAKKLKIDAVVEGKIEKRRDEFIIRLKLHEGRSGELVGNAIDTKAEGPRIEGRAQRDLKDELVGAIDNVESNHLGGGDDADDAKPSGKKGAKKTDDDADGARPFGKKGAKKTDDDADGARPFGKKGAKQTDDDADDARLSGKKGAKKTDDDADDARPVKKAFSKRSDDERGGDKVDKKGAKKPDDDDDALPAKKGAKKTDDKLAAKSKTDDDALPAKKVSKATKTDDDGDGDDPADKRAKKKKVASEDDDGAGAEVDAGAPVEAGTALSPGERALDAVIGMSLTARRMSFVFRSDLAMRPPGYRGGPVPGAMIDATVYPFAIGHKREGVLKNLGLSLMYDRVIVVNSKDMAGNVYASTESRFGIGAVFRYAFNRSATSPVVLGSLGYSNQAFTISSGATMVGVPNVQYSIFEPGLGLRYPLNEKIIAGLDLKLMAVTGTGQIQNADQYGSASVLGVEGALGVDYLITHNIFARAAFRLETIGYTFKGTGTLSNARDGNPATVDVAGARDTYIGGLVTVGYLY